MSSIIVTIELGPSILLLAPITEVPFRTQAERIDLDPANLPEDMDIGGIVVEGVFGASIGEFAFNILETGRIGAGDAPARIEITGDSTVTLLQAGTVFGDIQLGLGDDTVTHTGTITGEIRSGAGNDRLTISGTVDGDVLTGSGNDRVFLTGEIGGRVNPGDGNDRFSAVADGNYSSTDYAVGRVIGGKGSDRLFGGGNDDVLEGGFGRDILRGHDGNDTLLGGQGADLLAGGDGDDLLIGDSCADRMFGGNGDDDLRGASGQDVLTGGQGNDLLTGGSGADLFRFSGQSGCDTITDFRAQDVVDLDLDGFFSLPGDPEGLLEVSLSLDEIEVVASPFDVLVGYLSAAETGVTLDLDGFFAALGETDRTGGGAGQVNEIVFEGLSLSDLTSDSFMF